MLLPIQRLYILRETPVGQSGWVDHFMASFIRSYLSLDKSLHATGLFITHVAYMLDLQTLRAEGLVQTSNVAYWLKLKAARHQGQRHSASYGLRLIKPPMMHSAIMQRDSQIALDAGLPWSWLTLASVIHTL